MEYENRAQHEINNVDKYLDILKRYDAYPEIYYREQLEK